MITVGFHDATLARRLEEIFERDLRHCIELDAARWAARGWPRRAKDTALFALNDLL